MAEKVSESPLQRLAQAGQSIWYDNIRRSLLVGGGLAEMIDRDSVSGVTSNPTIFMKAIAESDEYDDAIGALAAQGMGPRRVLDALVAQDIRMAADILRPVWERSRGVDGWVSIEVEPEFAHDTKGSVSEAKRLRSLVDRPNVLVKVPATKEGVEALRRLTADGVCINVTLTFSLTRYGEVIEAFLAGLEELAAKGETGKDVPAPSDVHSVASFFVSRVDTLVDKKLDEMAAAAQATDPDRAARLRALRGKAAIANAKLAYQDFLAAFQGRRWRALESRGAHPQRPLWASTSTKNPEYRDVLYVEELIGPRTVNTMPQVTLDAFRDHGRVAQTLTAGVDEARKVLDAVESFGISMNQVTAKLEADGIKAFADSWDELFHAVRVKHEQSVMAGVRSS